MMPADHAPANVTIAYCITGNWGCCKLLKELVLMSTPVQGFLMPQCSQMGGKGWKNMLPWPLGNPVPEEFLQTNGKGGKVPSWF